MKLMNWILLVNLWQYKLCLPKLNVIISLQAIPVVPFFADLKITKQASGLLIREMPIQLAQMENEFVAHVTKCTENYYANVFAEC